MEASSLIHLNEPKFYLIQGPPGTGKSSTIVGILNATFARLEITNNKQPIKKNKKNKKKQPIRILICSPSNTGCDELLRKISSNCTSSSQSYLKILGHTNLKIVRLGRSDRIHADSRDFNFDILVMAKYEEYIEKYSKKVAIRIKNINEKIENAKKSDSQLNKREIKMLEDLLKSIENQKIIQQRTRTILWQQAQKTVLKEANIIISTLNYCGNSILDCLVSSKTKKKKSINMVIIDEAAQGIELESLIPLRFGCDKIIQVGDPKQLPATVMSKTASVHQIYSK